MLFSSMTFLFIFLPAVMAAYFLARRGLRNYILLAASIVFYAWGEPRYLAVMFSTIIINYAGAMLVDRTLKWRKAVLTLTVLADLGFLIYFKYFNFIAENVVRVLKTGDAPFLDVIMPIGISFYTFQAMSYLVDVYRRDIPVQKDIGKLALYIALFPQLVAGPIVKYHDVALQIDDRETTPEMFFSGIKRFVTGLAKKILIANTMGAVADKIFALPVEQTSSAEAWLGAIAYTFQLYYDFSGYSDMAIGLGLIFGFRFLENFNYPYISRSITEFWRRWHISLSTWFKEYLYIPLGGNRVPKWRNIFNLCVVFLATGVWHGACWTFVAWGVWHGAFIVFEKLTGWSRESENIFSKALHHIYASCAFIFGWVLFRSDSIAYAFDYMKNMLGVYGGHNIAYDFAYFVNNIEIITFAVAAVCSFPVFRDITGRASRNVFANIALNIVLLALFALSVASIASSTYNPFIYFRF